MEEDSNPCPRAPRTGTLRIGLSGLVSLLVAWPVLAQGPKAQPPAAATPSAAPAAAKPAAEPEAEMVVEPRAMQLLQAAWGWLGAQESYAFRADVQYDEVVGESTRLRVGGRVDVLVRRPDRFKVFFDGDRGQKIYLYDGKTFVLNDLRSRTWASAAVAGPNDAAVDTIVGKLGIVVPLSDFLVTGGAYSADEVRGAYVVGQSRVAGRRCHQVLLLLDDLDVQVWVEADGNPMIRRILLTHHDAPGAPQFEATFAEWYPPAAFSDYVFAFVQGESYRKVELAAPAAKE